MDTPDLTDDFDDDDDFCTVVPAEAFDPFALVVVATGLALRLTTSIGHAVTSVGWAVDRLDDLAIAHLHYRRERTRFARVVRDTVARL